MTTQTVAFIIAFALYLAFMVVIGLGSAKKNNNVKDYFLGGRKMGPWVTALSAEASDSSAWLLMGLPGLCYLGGIKETFWTALGLIAGTYLNWLIIAKPLRKCSISFGDSITIPEFFAKRFNDKKHILTIVSVLPIVVFFTIYTASGFVACGKLFESVFGIPYMGGLCIGLIVILTYTITGGYRAVCTTDFVQGVLIFFAFVVSSIVMIAVLGKVSNACDYGFLSTMIKDQIANAAKSAKEFNIAAIAGEFGTELQEKFTANQSFGVMSAISALSWALGYFGMPHIIVRFMGIRSNKEIGRARRVGMSWMLISYIGTFILGSLGTVYLKNRGIILNGNTCETVFAETMKLMYPGFIAGIFLCAILAASMSTADSQLLSAASAVSNDIYKGIINKKASEKKVLLISRVTVLVIAAVAFILCLLPNNKSIMGLVSYAWAGFGACFGPIIILALFWKRCTKEGAIAGIIGGFITVVVWHNLKGGIFNMYEILPGFIVCLLLAIVVSLFTKKDEEIEAQFDKFKAMKDSEN